MAKRPKREERPELSREIVLEHLAAHPGDTKRDLVRALGVKGPERQVLKQILSQLADEGTLERGRKRSYVPAGELPETAVLEIFGEDPDGEPLARPVQWESKAAPPSVLVLPGRDEVSAPDGASAFSHA